MAILNRGVPNQECIALKANHSVNMGQFGLMLGRYDQENSAVPYFDNLFWFGDSILRSDDWVFIYTGSGTPNENLAANGVNKVFNVFWGKPTTLFAESIISPILFRVDAVDVLSPPANQPQLMEPQNQ